MATMIFSIYVLASEQMETVDIVILSIYVVIVGLSQFVLVLCLIVVALAPVVLCGICIVCCFCFEGGSSSKNIDLPAK